MNFFRGDPADTSAEKETLLKSTTDARPTCQDTPLFMGFIVCATLEMCSVLSLYSEILQLTTSLLSCYHTVVLAFSDFVFKIK